MFCFSFPSLMNNLPEFIMKYFGENPDRHVARGMNPKNFF